MMNRLSSPRWHIATFILLASFLANCDSENTLPEEKVRDDDPVLTAEARVLGVCFMLEEKCLSPYIDLGPYNDDRQATAKTAIPVYVFPSVPLNAGGTMHPSDKEGLYNPYRLQNNVFADDGRVWAMWRVYSADLNLVAIPEPGVRIWGEEADQTADSKSGNLRDLFSNPYTSEKEILDAAEAGHIRLANLFKNVDCPIVEAKPNDIIVNLNSTFPICD